MTEHEKQGATLRDSFAPANGVVEYTCSMQPIGFCKVDIQQAAQSRTKYDLAKAETKRREYTVLKKKRKCIEYVHGDCLERIGVYIPRGGIAIVDSGCRPKVGNIVHVTRSSGAQSTYMKRVQSLEGGKMIVETAYSDPCRDFSFEAADLLGVVVEIYDRLFHNLIYERKRGNNK